jgi:hypothetical protein
MYKKPGRKWLAVMKLKKMSKQKEPITPRSMNRRTKALFFKFIVSYISPKIPPTTRPINTAMVKWSKLMEKN